MTFYCIVLRKSVSTDIVDFMVFFVKNPVAKFGFNQFMDRRLRHLALSAQAEYMESSSPARLCNETPATCTLNPKQC